MLTRTRWVIAAAAALIFLVPLRAEGEPNDPSTIPIPQLDFDDPTKSVVARVKFTSRTSATVERVKVSKSRAHTHIGDPPILKLGLTDVDGQVIDRINTWSPLWTYQEGSDHVGLRASGSGSFIVPFSPALSTMTITDVALGQDVLTIDLKPPLREFCLANPADPDCLEADLAVTSVTPVAPLFAVMGKPVTVTVTFAVANTGPDGPVTAVVRQDLAVGEGLTASAGTTVETSLAAGATQTLTREYTVTCDQAGAKTIDFTTSIKPKRATVIDPDPSDDTRTTRLTVDCAIPVTINIKPGSAENKVNLNGNGVVPVAVLTTTAGEYGNPVAFDAIRIDASTLRFGPPAKLLASTGAPEAHGKIHVEKSVEPDERTVDADKDAVTHYRYDVLSVGDTTACVVGRAAGLTFYGCDNVNVRD
ncbi:hypothetical protein GCM10009555_091530 [Acrocarpospora macrocephala]|uniref:DUF11 domain-containing protein n=1 Tax=Acrocarpospora macrocephala TaxID=150177 RepID=A0A5M3WLU1_9ACTN|nr:hypothetical protein [Acrocarpospora macrocephala]GES09129.1 hypothetical protein Amac_027250 [Acrocarpospora macrocephala]